MNESSITNFCIKMLSDENVKREVKNIYSPAINTIIQHIMPYIYFALIIILINFILLILILLYLFKTNYQNLAIYSIN